MDPAGGLKRQRSISDEANAQSPGAAAYTADAQPAAPSLATAAPLTPRDPPPEREDSDSSDDGPSKLELLARQLDALRQAGELPDHLVDPPTPPPILSSFDADGLAAYINDGSERDIVVMGGAGMSTAAGLSQKWALQMGAEQPATAGTVLLPRLPQHGQSLAQRRDAACPQGWCDRFDPIAP